MYLNLTEFYYRLSTLNKPIYKGRDFPPSYIISTLLYNNFDSQEQETEWNRKRNRAKKEKEKKNNATKQLGSWRNTRFQRVISLLIYSFNKNPEGKYHLSKEKHASHKYRLYIENASIPK